MILKVKAYDLLGTLSPLPKRSNNGNKANTLQSRAVVKTIRPKDEKAICKLS